MEKMTFSINIDAPAGRVWETLWNDSTYREWTSVFAAGSRAETDWKEGSKILFLDEKNEGMISEVAVNRPNEFMSIKHVGCYKNGAEDLESESSKAFAGALENYTLEDNHGTTALTVDMVSKGIPASMISYFQDTWPKALDKLREVAEK